MRQVSGRCQEFSDEKREREREREMEIPALMELISWRNKIIKQEVNKNKTSVSVLKF